MPDSSAELHRAANMPIASPRRARRWQAAASILLIVSDPSNMAWLTGYDGWSFYVHQARDRAAGRRAGLVRPRPGRARARLRTAYIGEDSIVGYPDNYVQSTERHPMELLAALLAERGWGKGTIGVEMDNYWFSAAAFATLQQHLPNARFIDATGAGQLAARGEEPAANSTTCASPAGSSRPCTGASSKRSSPACANAISSPRSRHRHRAASTAIGGDYPAIVPLLPSGSDAAAPHLTWDDKPMKRGRRHILRDRRLLQPLSLPAVAHRLSRQADAGLPRCGEGDAGRHGGGARGGETRQHLRGHRQRLLRGAEDATASSRTTAPAIRSGCPIRPTGASAR